MYEIISTGSQGNAVIYHKNIMVDCGVSFAEIENKVKSLSIVLLTHIHKDHFNLTTLQKLSKLRPKLRFGCCEWMFGELEGVRNIDVYQCGKVYNYGAFTVSPIWLYHDVLNCGYRIFTGTSKILHATDTAHLDGIEAKEYDLYALEHNYDEDTIRDVIREKESKGFFAYEKGAINTHLSEQQARDFYFKNKGENSKLIRLHEHR